MSNRVHEVVVPPLPWLPNLIRKLLRAYPERRGLTPGRLHGWLQRNREFRLAWRKGLATQRPQQRFVVPPEPKPATLPLRAAVPALHTPGDVAAWLDLSPSRLDGLADLRGWHRNAGSPLQHYRRWWVPSRRPEGLPRLLEAPKDQLRRVQRRLLRQILVLVPCHAAAHGFIEGRSVWTAAQPHAGEARLIRLDLRTFFPSIHRRRVVGVFTSMGFPREVAFLFGSLCTTRTPSSDLDASAPHLKGLYRDPHLPQGAPTSPWLANLCREPSSIGRATRTRPSQSHPYKLPANGARDPKPPQPSELAGAFAKPSGVGQPRAPRSRSQTSGIVQPNRMDAVITAVCG
ncbi:MAG: reverse transcriptase domain-containing protein [Myxococcota bacterium]